MRKTFILVLLSAATLFTGCDAKKSAASTVNSVEDAAAAKAKKIENFAKERINVDSQ
jgi:hypothetical protein